MNKENRTNATFQEPMRITRSRAKALGSSGGLPPLNPSAKQVHKRVLQPNSKRAASDDSKAAVSANVGLQHKKRAVLMDVTNVFCDNSYINCINAVKIQPSKQAKQSTAKNKAKVAPTVSLENLRNQEDTHTEVKTTQEITNLKVKDSQESGPQLHFDEDSMIRQGKCISIKDAAVADQLPIKQTSTKHASLQIPSLKEEGNLCCKSEALHSLGIADIDSNHKDPQMCSMYAPDIYNNIRVLELSRRPSVNYMEMLQQDITQGMRSILIDWLVEVSEEYRLVPDTLYLTVNLIDRFLSQMYIEKQKLQLLGVTCMLIASKYEQVCAPSAEEFCFITDNTYTKGEVLKMESRVLNFLGFQLSGPTTMKFLRRFIQAAQACYKVPCVELDFLANYLAELALVDYSFLKFLPSLIAASAVFLARWTLNQSDYPWNPTLQHYTSYKASELKGTVLALQDLQHNTNGCSLNAIREKYKQQKFKNVATLSSQNSVQSLF
ncbi:unnamed protein product [Ilex paraguariensis]|uniref:B-like cyclin n=1 Tax=Ilex paraguariensis TaxID=185542 RepID=A0ABC8UWL5_9AQUA